MSGYSGRMQVLPDLERLSDACVLRIAKYAHWEVAMIIMKRERMSLLRADIVLIKHMISSYFTDILFVVKMDVHTEKAFRLFIDGILEENGMKEACRQQLATCPLPLPIFVVNHAIHTREAWILKIAALMCSAADVSEALSTTFTYMDGPCARTLLENCHVATLTINPLWMVLAKEYRWDTVHRLLTLGYNLSRRDKLALGFSTLQRGDHVLPQLCTHLPVELVAAVGYRAGWEVAMAIAWLKPSLHYLQFEAGYVMHVLHGFVTNPAIKTHGQHVYVPSKKILKEFVETATQSGLKNKMTQPLPMATLDFACKVSGNNMWVLEAVVSACIQSDIDKALSLAVRARKEQVVLALVKSHRVSAFENELELVRTAEELHWASVLEELEWYLALLPQERVQHFLVVAYTNMWVQFTDLCLRSGVGPLSAIEIRARNEHDMRFIAVAAKQGCNAVMRDLMDTADVDVLSQCVDTAVRNRHIHTVKLLLSNLRLTPSTALIEACRIGHCEIIALLLANRRVDPTFSDHEALMRACEGGRVDALKILCADTRVAVPLRSMTSDSLTDRQALFYRALCASAKGSLPALEHIVRCKPEGSNISPNVLAQALELAVHGEKTDVVGYLLQFDVNSERALYTACCEGHCSVLRVLLADCKHNTIKQRSEMLRRAIRGGHGNIVRALFDWTSPSKFGDPTTYITALEQTHITKTQSLWPHGEVEVSMQTHPHLNMLQRIQAGFRIRRVRREVNARAMRHAHRRALRLAQPSATTGTVVGGGMSTDQAMHTPSPHESAETGPHTAEATSLGETLSSQSHPVQMRETVLSPLRQVRRLEETAARARQMLTHSVDTNGPAPSDSRGTPASRNLSDIRASLEQTQSVPVSTDRSFRRNTLSAQLLALHARSLAARKRGTPSTSSLSGVSRGSVRSVRSVPGDEHAGDHTTRESSDNTTTAHTDTTSRAALLEGSQALSRTSPGVERQPSAHPTTASHVRPQDVRQPDAQRSGQRTPTALEYEIHFRELEGPRKLRRLQRQMQSQTCEVRRNELQVELQAETALQGREAQMLRAIQIEEQRLWRVWRAAQAQKQAAHNRPDTSHTSVSTASHDSTQSPHSRATRTPAAISADLARAVNSNNNNNSGEDHKNTIPRDIEMWNDVDVKQERIRRLYRFHVLGSGPTSCLSNNFIGPNASIATPADAVHGSVGLPRRVEIVPEEQSRLTGQCRSSPVAHTLTVSLSNNTTTNSRINSTTNTTTINTTNNTTNNQAAATTRGTLRAVDANIRANSTMRRRHRNDHMLRAMNIHFGDIKRMIDTHLGVPENAAPSFLDHFDPCGGYMPPTTDPTLEHDAQPGEVGVSVVASERPAVHADALDRIDTHLVNLELWMEGYTPPMDDPDDQQASHSDVSGR